MLIPSSRSLFLLGALACARLAATPSLTDLDWSLRYGDDPAWAQAVPEVPCWQPINLGISWERQNLHNGETAWLRKDVVLPASAAGRPLVFDLQMGAERVDVVVNGTPLAPVAAPAKPTQVEIPAGVLRADRPNHLALRVVGHAWTGGSNDDVVRLRPADGATPQLAIETAFAPTDHVFGLADDAAFDTTLCTGDLHGPVTVTLAIVSAFHARISTQARTFVPEEPAPTLHWSAGRLAPGFYQVQVRASADGYHAQHISWFAVAPTQVPCSANPPADLDAYWARAKAELAAVPPNFRMTKDERRSDARHTVHTVEMASVDGVTLRAWYIVPTRPGPHPAVLDVPGYTVAMQPEWYLEDDDLIHLALDIRGHGRSADVVNPGFGTPGLVGHRINEPEHYVYKGAYLDCGRALEFLATRPEVDSRRIAVMGGSQSGGLAFATAALFPERIAACSAGMPFLGDFADHQRIRDVYRAEMQAYVDHYAGCTWADIHRSMSLVDTVNLAPRIRCPVLMCTGLFDDDCPSYVGFAVYNAVRSEKRHIVYPDEAHLLGPRWQAAARAWVRGRLGLPPEE